MANITPFTFENHNVRVITDKNGEPLFVGKDICEALGYKNATDAMNQHCKGVAKRYPLQTAGGVQELRVISEPDVMRLVVSSTLPAAESFERLVFEEILPTIRKTGSYVSKGGNKPIPPSDVDAFKIVPMVIRAARAMGLDKNSAAISANQAIFKMTGTNVLQLLGSTHLDNPEQKLYFTPTEIGLKIGGISARRVNMLLAEAGLQVKQGDKWEPLPKSESVCRILDTGKAHHNGTPVQQVKWSEDVIDMIHQPRSPELADLDIAA